jgi:hypothetical protein
MTKKKNYHLTERSYGVFYRAFQLPVGIDPASVEATMSNEARACRSKENRGQGSGVIRRRRQDIASVLPRRCVLAAQKYSLEDPPE